MTMRAGGDGPSATRPADAFEFGRNWQRYVESHLSQDRVDVAARSLVDLVGESLSGKVFLDIGAGSGLFSLCAYRAGAAKVISVDVDPNSVDACRTLRKSVGDPENWEIIEGSILDSGFISTLPHGDVVYSWGVLHHTGDMYTALQNTAKLVTPAGILCIAIYNRVTGRFLDSPRWRKIKRRYNRSPRLAQRAMEMAYLVVWSVHQLYRRRNPLAVAAEYKHSRGMALSTDLIDWLGGYPYEYASADEIITFCRSECGLKEVKVIRADPRDIANNQFVFRRADGR